MALLTSDVQTQMSAQCGVGTAQTALYAKLIYAIQHALDDLYARRWTWNRVRSQFTTTAPYETGTISGSAGSTTVTGSGTSWDTTWTGAYLDANSTRHQIASVGSTTALTLSAELESAVAASTAYEIHFPTVSLTATLRDLVHVSSDPYDPLAIVSPGEVMELFGGQNTGSFATHAALLAPDSNKASQILLGPWPSEARMYTYEGYRSAPTLSASTETGVPDDYRALLTELALSYWWNGVGDYAPARSQACRDRVANDLLPPRWERDKASSPGPRTRRGWRNTRGSFPRPYSTYDIWT